MADLVHWLVESKSEDGSVVDGTRGWRLEDQ